MEEELMTIEDMIIHVGSFLHNTKSSVTFGSSLTQS